MRVIENVLFGSRIPLIFLWNILLQDFVMYKVLFTKRKREESH